MNDSDEKFFEALGEQKVAAAEEYKVELAKTAGNVAQKPHLAQKEDKTSWKRSENEQGYFKMSYRSYPQRNKFQRKRGTVKTTKLAGAQSKRHGSWAENEAFKQRSDRK